MENVALQTLGRRIRLGIVGGAAPSLIGPVHREAARLDNLFSLEACVLSSNPEKGRQAAKEFGIPRAYVTTMEMFETESARDDGIDAVSIATPNDSHFRILCEALDAGLHVICDKPLTTTLNEALKVRQKAQATGRVVVLTHNYSGYPMVRQARAMTADDQIGNVHQIHGVYAVGQMGQVFENDASKIAPSMRWRIDPERGGESHALIDIGSHIHHLASFISGQQVSEVIADLGNAVSGRSIHDSANILLRYPNGGFGTFWITKAASGANKLKIELYGDKGGLLWEQANANTLVHMRQDEPVAHIARQSSVIYPAARRAMRGPGIQFVEGFREAFANIYVDFAELVVAAMSGRAPDRHATEVPGLIDGLRSLAFIEACLASSKSRSWVSVRSTF